MPAVETVFDINSDKPIWYDIPGFPGYQITYDVMNDINYVRSFKQYKIHPYGVLITHANKTTWKLTNHNNQVVLVTSEELWELIRDYQVKPVPSYVTRTSGRNNRINILPDEEVSVGILVKKPRDLRIDGQKLSFPDFSHLK